MTLRLPTTFDEITAGWLNRAFTEFGSADPSLVGVEAASFGELTAVTVEPLGASVGLLGDLARLHLEYRDASGPATMIVKLPTADPGGHQVGRMLHAWGREVAFYTDVAATSPQMRIPRCYYAGGEPTSQSWVVVLEDCPHEPVDAFVGASLDQARLAVEALADFHALWWDADRRFDWMPGFDVNGVGGLKGPWLDAIPTFLERYGHLIPEPTGDWLQRFAPRLDQWSDRAANEPLTIVHADYRLDNLLFSPHSTTADVHRDGTGDTAAQVTMIDWQTALRGPGAMDLTCFLVTALTIEDRRSHERALIDHYRRRLALAGVETDDGWFARSFDENLLWWMGQFANNLARLHPDDETTQRALDTMIERTYAAALDHNVGRLLPARSD